MLKKQKEIISSILLITVFAITVNNSFFWHSHVLSDGKVIVHSRPFCHLPLNSAKGGHTDNDPEIVFWNSINLLFSNTVLITGVALQLLLIFLHITGLKLKDFHLPEIIFYTSPRAPPYCN